MLVLGIDPGTLRTGYGLVEGDRDSVRPIGFGAIATSSKDQFPFRLQKIYDAVRELIESHRP